MVRAPSPLRSTAKFHVDPEISPTRIFFFSFYYEMIYFFEKFRDSRIEWKVCILENGTWTENSSYHHFLIILFFFLHWRFKVAILKNTIYIIKLKSIGEYNENINFLANLKTRNAEDPLLSEKKGEP